MNKPTLKSIKKKLREIEDIQAKTEVRNFHPYKKAIEAIIICIKSHLQSSDFEEKLIDDKLEELDRLIAVFEKTYKWCKSHKFFPFQLPFNESICEDEQTKLKIFIPSACVKYIDYENLNYLISHFKREKEYLNYYFGLSKDRKEIEILKEGIKNTDKKAIDLIALFTAAITFLFGVVNIFVMSNEVNLSNLIINTTGLGIILALFMCLYLLISPMLIQKLNWKNYLKTWRFILGILGIIMYASLVFLLYKNFPSNNSLNADQPTNEIKHELIDNTYN